MGSWHLVGSELGLAIMKGSWGKWCDIHDSAVLYAREGVKL